MGPWLDFCEASLNRATIGVFDGTPNGREFGTFVQRAGTTMLGVVPAQVKALAQFECSMDSWIGASIKVLSSTGECSNAADMRWLMELAGGKPVIEYCGGTEIGGGYITGTLDQTLICQAPSIPLPWAWILLFWIVEGNSASVGVARLCLASRYWIVHGVALTKTHHQVYFAGALPRDFYRPFIAQDTATRCKTFGDGYWCALAQNC